MLHNFCNQDISKIRLLLSPDPSKVLGPVQLKHAALISSCQASIDAELKARVAASQQVLPGFRQPRGETQPISESTGMSLH